MTTTYTPDELATLVMLRIATAMYMAVLATTKPVIARVAERTPRPADPSGVPGDTMPMPAHNLALEVEFALTDDFGALGLPRRLARAVDEVLGELD